jgi:hypothetical protein
LSGRGRIPMQCCSSTGRAGTSCTQRDSRHARRQSEGSRHEPPGWFGAQGGICEHVSTLDEGGSDSGVGPARHVAHCVTRPGSGGE